MSKGIPALNEAKNLALLVRPEHPCFRLTRDAVEELEAARTLRQVAKSVYKEKGNCEEFRDTAKRADQRGREGRSSLQRAKQCLDNTIGF